MTDTADPELRPGAAPVDVRRQSPGSPRRERRAGLRWAVALVCAVLGFVLVAQVRATEGIGDRLQAEREEDLARILADLTAESDRLQSEITELRITLLSFENAAEQEELALRSLERRLDDLRILAGIVPAEGEGVMVTVEDPAQAITQDLLVDTVQELRDAGAEAIAVNGVRLVAQSAFSTRNERLLVDGQPLESPYRIAAVGPGETMGEALRIFGGAVATLQSVPGVTVTVETRAQLIVPPRAESVPFVFGEPVPPEEAARPDQ
jgi:uncharacterized protein YlxW (UPF0749 family)